MDLSNIRVNAQSSIRIEGSRTLYFDAFRIAEETHDADIIFITHEHFDHFDVESIRKIIKPESVIVAPETMRNKLMEAALAQEEKCVFLTPGMDAEVDGIRINGIPAYNVLKPFHPKHNKWLGYEVTMDETVYYVAGDTDVTEDARKVKCDVALIPIGGMYTMNAKQAAEYVVELAPKAVVPTHYGDVAGKPEDGENFRQQVEKAGRGIQVEMKL